jgi:large subunit ribosomal protein L24e
MKRNPRKLKWTKAYRANAGKEMICDSTLLFGARRNIPQRYNRELVAKTVEAMRRIGEIRARRERMFYKKRMAGKPARELAAARKLVAENQHLLPRLRGTEKRHLIVTASDHMDSKELADESAHVDKVKRKVSGPEMRRLRLRVDGHIEQGLLDNGEDWEDDGDKMELG